MNFLGHSFFSFKNPYELFGNFAGDFFKGNLSSIDLHDEIKVGISLHRIIDGYTEGDPFFSSSRKRIIELTGKYSGVVIDMLYDHFLAKNWDSYMNIKLYDYSKNIYNSIDCFASNFPDKFALIYPRMKNTNWLFLYKDLEGIRKALNGLTIRINHQCNLNNDLIFNFYDAIEDDFYQFMHKIIHESLIKKRSF